MAGQFNGAGAASELASSLLALPVMHQVVVYALNPVRLLTVLHHHNAIVAAACFAAPDQLLTVTTDGSVATWDTKYWKLTSSYNVGGAVTSMVVPHGCALAHITMQPHESGLRVRFLKKADGALLHVGIKLSSANPLTVSCDGRAVATWDGWRALVWAGDQFDGSAVQPLVLRHTKAIECMALSPTAGVVAVGDTSGRIYIWSNCVEGVKAAAATTVTVSIAAGGEIDGQESDCMPAPRMVHWHSRSVLTLAFSLNSMQLLSGGHEAVLVTWELANNTKSFVTGLSGSITCILPAQQHGSSYVTLHADNSLWQVDTSTGSLAVIDVGLLPRICHAGLPAPLNRPGHHGQVLVASALGRVQIFDSAHRKNVAQLQVARSSRMVDHSFRAAYSICHVAVSGDGLTVVVVEGTPAAQGSNLVYKECLNTWVYNSATCCFHSLTSTDSPICAPICCMVHHPFNIQLAVGGSDGSLTLCAASPSDFSWQRLLVLPSTGCKVGCFAYNFDGSLLVAATAEQLLLYDMTLGTLCMSMPHVATMPALPPCQLFFSPCGLLVAVDQCSAGEVRLTAWNLLTSRIQWTSTTPAQSTRSSSTGGRIAVSARCSSSSVLDSMDPGDSGDFDSMLQLSVATGQALDSWMAARHSFKSLLYKSVHDRPHASLAKPPIVSFPRAGVCHNWSVDASATPSALADMLPDSSDGKTAFFKPEGQPSGTTEFHGLEVPLPGSDRQSHALQSVMDNARGFLLDLACSG